MRVKTVKFAGKDITIREYKIKELNELVDKIGTGFDSLVKANEFADAKNAIIDILKDKLTIIFPTITKEDIDEAYPSEIEELIGGFIDVNFTGLKKVVLPLLKLRLQQLFGSQGN